jgi:hypothetical protein
MGACVFGGSAGGQGEIDKKGGRQDTPVTNCAAHLNSLALGRLIRLNRPREYVVKTHPVKEIG